MYNNYVCLSNTKIIKPKTRRFKAYINEINIKILNKNIKYKVIGQYVS